MLRVLAKKSSINLAVRIFGSLCSLVMSAYIARNYSLYSAGAFFLMISYISILSSISLFGLNNELMRKASFFFTEGDYKRLGQLFTSCSFTMITGALFLGFFLFIFKFSFVTSSIILAIPFVSLITFCGIFLQSCNRYVYSSLIQFVLLPISVVIGLIAFSNNVEIEVIYLLSAVLVSVVGLYQVSKTLSHKVAFKIAITKTTTSLLVFQILFVINQNIGQVLLDIYSSNDDVAIFSVSKRITMTLGFAVTAINAIAAPKLSSYFLKNDMRGLRSTIKNSSRILVAFSVPVIGFIFLFPEFLLSFFGKEYTSQISINVFLILALGQIVNVVTGTVAYLLIMTNNESAHLKNLIIASVCSFSLYIFLMPKGIYGISLMIAFSMVIQNILSWYSCKKLLNVNTLNLL